METLIITPKSKKDLPFLKELLKNLNNVAGVKVGKEEKPKAASVNKKPAAAKNSASKTANAAKPVTRTGQTGTTVAKAKPAAVAAETKPKSAKKADKKKGKKGK